MYDEKRLHGEVVPRLPQLSAAIGTMLAGGEAELFSDRSQDKPLRVPGQNNKNLQDGGSE